jgi:hypothetical protein
MTKTFKKLLKEINLNTALLKPRADQIRKQATAGKWDAQDKKDFETAAKFLDKGDLRGFNKFIHTLDSFPRDEILHSAGLWNTKLPERMNHVGRNVSQKLSYDNWLKKVKGIEKGVHGIKGDEHTKLSKQWKDYRGQDKLAASYEQVELTETSWKIIYKTYPLHHHGEKSRVVKAKDKDDAKSQFRRTSPDTKIINIVKEEVDLVKEESPPWEYVMGNLTKDDKDTLQDFSDNFGPRVGGNIKYATKYAVDKILANTEKNLQKLSPAGKKAYKDLKKKIKTGPVFKKVKEEVELEEGYEGHIIAHLGELGIDTRFSYSKLVVKKADLARVKDSLKDGVSDRGSIIYGRKIPEIVIEEIKLEEGIKPYVSMLKKDVRGRRVMHYIVLDKDEKEILVTTDKGKAERFLSKNYNKLRSGSMKPVKEETELEEGRMKELHTLIQQGKSAEEIAKIMKLDVKTIQSLMPKENVDEANNKPYVIVDRKTGKKVAGPLNYRQALVKRKQLETGPESQYVIRFADTTLGTHNINISIPSYRGAKEEVNEVSPPGWGGSVKAMKKHAGIDNPYALAWHMKNKGDKPHYKDKDGTPVKKDKYKDEEMAQVEEQSYKDKFNAALKHFSINSLDDLKSDEEKKKFFSYVDSKHKADNEEVEVTEDKGYTDQQIKQAYGILNDPKYKGGNYSGAVKAIEKLAKGLSDHPDVANALKRANESKDLEEKLSAKDLELVKVNNYVTIKGRQYVIDKLLPNNKIKAFDKAGDLHTFNINDIDSIKYWKDEEVELTEKAEVKWDKAKAGWYDKQGRRRYLSKGATMDLMKKAIDKAKASGDWTSFVNVDKHRYLSGEKEKTEMKKEDHDCAKVHPDKPHQEWAKDNLKKAQYENIELGEGSLTSTQIQNIKKLWNDPEKKTAKDVTQAVKDIVKKWDNDTRYAVSQAGIKHLSKLAAATESTNRYFDVKPGSLEDSINKMNKLEEMSVTINKKQVDDLVKQYISKGGVVTKLPPVLAPVAPGEKPPKEWDLVKGKSVPGSNQGQIAYKVKKVGSGYKILKAQLREFIRIYNEHFLTNYAAEEFIVEATEKEGSMVGKYKVKYDFTANEFGFVNTQAKKDNHDKVGGNSGVKKMIKQGKTVDQISKEFGMFKDAVKSMAEEK